MLESEKVLQNYENRKSEINNAIASIASEIKAETAQLAETKEQYKELVRGGQDDEADQLYSDIENLEQSIKRKKNRWHTKKELSGDGFTHNAIECLAYAPKVKRDFKEKVDENDKKLKEHLTVIKDLLDERYTLNEAYKDIYSDFISVKDTHEKRLENDNEALSEFKNVTRPFRVGYRPPEFFPVHSDLKNQVNGILK